MNEKFNINELKDIVQDCNINFLLGSGMSMPYLSTLGNIEQLLTELAKKKEKGEIIRVSLYKYFFDEVIVKNLKILENSDDDKMNDVLESYIFFLRTLNSILLNRKSTILNKQVNLFTTNIDIFLEKALEITNVEYNDGFSGRFNPLFNLTNFKKSFFKTSLHYDNISELPVFNLIKIHGSLTWYKKENEDIAFSHDLRLVKKIESIPNLKSIKIKEEENIDELIEKANKIKTDNSVNEFITDYEKLAIVNPTKEKFRETVLNRNYYELLRIYSNELEKENTVLFVAGFSFADEHIRDVTIRVANSNPTLKVYIFSYSSERDEGVQKIEELSNNNNVEIVDIPQEKKENGNKETEDTFNYYFKTINEKVFGELLKQIGEKEEAKKL